MSLIANNQKARWLKDALLTVLEYTDDPTIVEFGGMRFPYEIPSDGASTMYFFNWLNQLGKGKLYSVDNSPVVCSENRKRFESSHVEIWAEASFLKTEIAVDLLYLDSVQEATLGHLQAALPKLHPNGIIVMDDSHEHDGNRWGKVEAVLPLLRRQGWWLFDVPTESLGDTWYRMVIGRRTWPVLV